jgi:hypothetical protein
MRDPWKMIAQKNTPQDNMTSHTGFRVKGITGMKEKV